MGSTVQRAYEGTLVGSPLRRLMVDMHNYHGHDGWIKEENNMEFLVDLVRDMFTIRTQPSGPDPTGAAVDSCPYHHHGNDGLYYSRENEKRNMTK